MGLLIIWIFLYVKKNNFYLVKNTHDQTQSNLIFPESKAYLIVGIVFSYITRENFKQELQ